MINATVNHLFVGFIGLAMASHALKHQDLLITLAHRNFVGDASVCTSQHLNMYWMVWKISLIGGAKARGMYQEGMMFMFSLELTYHGATQVSPCVSSWRMLIFLPAVSICGQSRLDRFQDLWMTSRLKFVLGIESFGSEGAAELEALILVWSRYLRALCRCLVGMPPTLSRWSEASLRQFQPLDWVLKPSTKAWLSMLCRQLHNRISSL